MKSSDSTSLASLVPSVPSMFQIAAFFEEFFPGGQFRQHATPLGQLPFAEFMNPDKLIPLLRALKRENGAVAALQQNPTAPAPVKRSSRNVSPKRSVGTGEGKLNGSALRLPRKVEFSFESPTAEFVKLAGDFTNWEQAPIDMMHSNDGLWFTVVPLEPGEYSYRFIVDGSWCNDPRSNQRVPNPFGTENEVIRVT